MELSQELREAIADFHKLQSLHSLPPLMDHKLRLLESVLLNAPIAEDIVDLLPLNERLSLEEMPWEAQSGLFCSIVRCLSGR